MCFVFQEEQWRWNPGCRECQSKFLQTPFHGVFTLNWFFLCASLSEFSHTPLSWRVVVYGRKILLTSRAVHFFLPNITSLKGVHSSRFDPEAPLHPDQLWLKLPSNLCLGKAFTCLLPLAERDSDAEAQSLRKHPCSSGFTPKNLLVRVQRGLTVPRGQ